MNSTSDRYRFANAVVEVEWADAAVRAALGTALEHRRVTDGETELLVRTLTGETYSAGERDELIFGEDDDGWKVIEPSRRMSHRLQTDGAVAEFRCESAATLPGHECAAPFRLILQAWLQRRAVQMLHAGAVGLPDRGAVLLAAPSGGGKSNTVLACLAHSTLQVLGEDYVAVDSATARVWSLYGAAKLWPKDLARFPALPDHTLTPDGKALLQLGDRTGRWGDGLPLRAILALRITGKRETRIVTAPPAEAVKAMLTSLLMVLPAARRQLFEFTTRLAARLPVYRLELGSDPPQIAAAVQQFLSS